MEATRPPAERIGVGKVVSETFSIYGQNAAALIGSAAIVFVLVGLASGLLQNAGGIVFSVLATLVSLIGYAVYVGFVVRLVQDVRDGRRDHTVGDLFSSASPAIASLIAFGILFGIGVTIGLILLVIPGLILITVWSVGAPAIVVEQVGSIDAFGRSWSLVRGQAWSVFGVLLVVLVIVLAIDLVLAAITTPIGSGAMLIGSIVSGIVTAPIFSLAVSVLYFDLGGAAAVEPVAPTV